MRQIVVLAALLAVLGVGVVGFAVAQDMPGTPGAELCASPEGSPVASPDASPEIDTSASPAVVATEVVEGIEGGLDDVVCGTPPASPAA